MAEETRYSAPEKYIVIPRDDWYIFYDPVHFSYVRVNEHGKAILESIDQEQTVSEISRTVASKYGIEPSNIIDQVAAFLDNMLSTGFIHRGSYRPAIETPNMDEVTPSMLYLHPTYRCNLRCIYCYNAEDRSDAGSSELSTDEWYAVLDQARDMGVESIVFTGGEPLLRQDIFRLAEYAADVGLRCLLLTNAWLVNEKNIDRIVELFRSVGVSLDSHIRETNDFLRSPGAYDRTIRAMTLLQQHNHPFTMRAVITRHNVHHMPGLHKFFLEQFDGGNINAGLYVPNSSDDTDLLPPLDVYRQVMTEANSIIDDHYKDDWEAAAKFHRAPSRQFQCGAAAGEFAIAPDGSVYPCQALLSPEFCAGNIKNTGLNDIYRTSPIMKQVRNCTVEAIETCRDCDVKNICAGGCRSLAYNLYGRIDCHNAYSCKYLKDVACNVLWKAASIPIDKLREMKEKRESAAGA